MNATAEKIYLWDVERVAQASFPDRTHPQHGAIHLALTASEEDVSTMCDLDAGSGFHWDHTWTSSRELDRLADGALATIATFSMNARQAHHRWEFNECEVGPSLTTLFQDRLWSYKEGRTQEQWKTKRDELIRFLVRTAQHLYRHAETREEREELFKAVFDKVEG